MKTTYEDDGISNAYLEGASRKTSITLARSGNRITLDIGVATGTFELAPMNRMWVLRLHLPTGATLTELTANGRTVLQQAYRVIDPQAVIAAAQLLAGAGSATSDQVVELALDCDVSSSAIVSLLLR